jgi:hypothetical protein
VDQRDEIQRIAVEFGCYGRLRMTAELRDPRWQVNHLRGIWMNTAASDWHEGAATAMLARLGRQLDSTWRMGRTQHRSP